MLLLYCPTFLFFFFFQAEDGIRDTSVTGVQTCALPIAATILWIGSFRPALRGATDSLAENCCSLGIARPGVVSVRRPRPCASRVGPRTVSQRVINWPIMMPAPDLTPAACTSYGRGRAQIGTS